VEGVEAVDDVAHTGSTSKIAAMPTGTAQVYAAASALSALMHPAAALAISSRSRSRAAAPRMPGCDGLPRRPGVRILLARRVLCFARAGVMRAF
jgi:hypothetical protein